MQLKLEQLEYQQRAIQSVVDIFKGLNKNTFDLSSCDGIRTNTCQLTSVEIEGNVKEIIESNGLNEFTAKLANDSDFCIEMETGTGKTLVYLKTIFELHKNCNFTKFIILVPSVAIKEGVLATFQTFEKQIEDIYGFKPTCFEYDSSKLNRVKSFIEEQYPQIMVMTIQSFNSEDRILNQAEREDLFQDIPYIEAIAKTRPIIIMDEPQEGMDTENSIRQIARLNPLCKIRYSATHKVLKNLLYRLNPYDSYKQNIVKKIEVLTVTEKNDEATMKLELSQVRTFKDGKTPEAKIKAWRSKNDGSFEFKETPFLKVGDNLWEKTKNVSYKDYVIKRIWQPLREKKFHIEFSNGAVIVEKEQSKNYQSIFSEQLKWLIDTHFMKKEKLSKKGIKCLSLVFIDRVDNYIAEDGIIRKLFEEKFASFQREKFGKTLSQDEIKSVQGYYFAKTNKGEYTDNDSSMRNNKELFDLILKDKGKLLSFDNPVEFIFSHSALGVGWDNPNVFNIATMNQSYSEIKKRQEIGRGLRICVNQDGQRIYDNSETPEGEEVNLLTVIPNETYETFIRQYQSEIQEIYGSTDAGAVTRHNEKGCKIGEKKIKRNKTVFESKSFRDFWKKLSRTTDYTVYFDEEVLVRKSIEALNTINIHDYEIEASLYRIKELKPEFGSKTESLGSETVKATANFAPIDLVEEISESTCLSYRAVIRILKNISNYGQLFKNPHKYIQCAISLIKNIELDEMLRGLKYEISGTDFDLELIKEEITTYSKSVQETPNQCLYDHIVYDSDFEKEFAKSADNADDTVVCFLKLPSFYKIKTPIGDYNPDFGVVLKKKKIHQSTDEEFYFVVEVKGTNDINDKKSLKQSEVFKIMCAEKHFEKLGIDTNLKYIAPVKDYVKFKEKSE